MLTSYYGYWFYTMCTGFVLRALAFHCGYWLCTKGTEFVFGYWLCITGDNFVIGVLTLDCRYWLCTMGTHFVLCVLTLDYGYWLCTTDIHFVLHLLTLRLRTMVTDFVLLLLTLLTLDSDCVLWIETYRKCVFALWILALDCRFWPCAMGTDFGSRVMWQMF